MEHLSGLFFWRWGEVGVVGGEGKVVEHEEECVETEKRTVCVCVVVGSWLLVL